MNNKIIPFLKLKNFVRKLKKSGSKIIHCHGTFDLVHPGHVIHFEEAKSLGDILIVTITGEKYVNKGPGKPFFDDNLRSKTVANLEPVDYVSIVPHPAAVEAIETVCPHIYCKCKEY